jgi:hypothetical protein
MSAINDFIVKESLFSTHNHQRGYSALAQKVKDLSYHDLYYYAIPDWRTARCLTKPDCDDLEELRNLSDTEFFETWKYVRTTGYGQAVEAACKILTGLKYTQANTEAINTKLNQLVKGKTPAHIYEQLYAKARIKWDVNDIWPERRISQAIFKGMEHPAFDLKKKAHETREKKPEKRIMDSIYNIQSFTGRNK